MAGVERAMGWKKLSSCITGAVDQELLWHSNSLVTENRILGNHVKGGVWLSEDARKALAESGTC
jgi:hypothetical protein